MEATKNRKELGRVEAKEIARIREGVNTPELYRKEPYRSYLTDFSLPILEEGMGGCPWRILVCCIIRSTGNTKKDQGPISEEVRSVAAEVLCKWDRPESLAEAKHVEVSLVTAKLFQGYRKARSLIDMSRRWITDDWDTILDLPGINLLGIDAIRRLVPQCGQAPPANGQAASSTIQQP